MSLPRTRNYAQRLLTGLMVLAPSMATEGCRDTPSPTSDLPPQEKFVGFVGKSQDDPLWPVLQAGAMRYLEQAGPTPVRFEAPPIESPHQQNAIIRQMTDQGMAALCLDPVDPDLCRTAIEYAYNRGVRTFTMVHDATSPLRSAFIGPNEPEIGKLLARTMALALNGKGNIIVMHAGSEDPLTGGRYLHFRSALRREPGLKVLKWENCHGNLDRAHTLLKELLIKFPHIDGIVLVDNWPLRQHTVDEFQILRTCKIISTASTPTYWPFIEKGFCYALIGTNYGKIGFEALRLARSSDGAATGGDRREYVPSRVLMENNLAQYKMDWHAWATLPQP